MGARVQQISGGADPRAREDGHHWRLVAPPAIPVVSSSAYRPEPLNLIPLSPGHLKLDYTNNGRARVNVVAAQNFAATSFDERAIGLF